MSAERVMTCAEVEGLLDAFIDAELPAPALLAVARHAGGCEACERVWPAVSQGVERHDARVEWRRRLRTVPAWGVALAVAASAVLWMRSPEPEPARLAAAPRRNQAVIERIDSSGHFELRRDRKYGTTLIMVSDQAGQ